MVKDNPFRMGSDTAPRQSMRSPPDTARKTESSSASEFKRNRQAPPLVKKVSTSTILFDIVH